MLLNSIFGKGRYSRIFSTNGNPLNANSKAIYHPAMDADLMLIHAKMSVHANLGFFEVGSLWDSISPERSIGSDSGCARWIEETFPIVPDFFFRSKRRLEGDLSSIDPRPPYEHTCWCVFGGRLALDDDISKPINSRCF
jgi:hypothetical protein